MINIKEIRNTLIILICLFINISVVSASTNTYERTESNNYGVNKHWNITDKNISNVKNTPYVDASEKVYDFADILTESEEKEVYQKIQEFISSTNMDMVFVSIDMSYTYDSKNEEFAADFYDYNDFGINFQNYSGILLLRNDYEKDRYYDMYTFGNAQSYFNQTRYDDVLDSIYSNFVNKNYLEGINTFVDKCELYYNKGIVPQYKNSYIDSNGYLRNKYQPPIFLCLVISCVITLITMIILVKKNKMIKKAVMAHRYLDRSTINYTEKVDQFVTSHTYCHRYSESSGGGSSGGFGGGSHSGSSGGGHSSGGGRHG